MWMVRIPIALVFASILFGCKGTGGVGGGGWPTQSYPYACETSMIPMEPSCLSSAEFDNGFKYRDQFQACRIDLQTFQNALNEHSRCSSRKLKSIFGELMKTVPATYNCYVDFFEDKEEGDPSVACPAIKVPRFHHSYKADGLEYDLGVPRCIRKSGEYNFAPKRAYQLDDCREQVEIFTGKKVLGYSTNATAAQKQYDTYTSNLRRVLDEAASDAVRKFNCYADGRDYCY